MSERFQISASTFLGRPDCNNISLHCSPDRKPLLVRSWRLNSWVYLSLACCGIAQSVILRPRYALCPSEIVTVGRRSARLNLDVCRASEAQWRNEVLDVGRLLAIFVMIFSEILVTAIFTPTRDLYRSWINSGKKPGGWARAELYES